MLMMQYFRNAIILGAILILFCSQGKGADDVCFEGLGCFSQDEPWVSALRPFPPPEKPQDIDVSLMFFSREQKEGEMVTVYPNITFKGKGFVSKRRTVTITHGFQSSASSDWVKHMKDKYLKVIDANVFLVNWEKGASSKNYFQAAANTRVAGAILGRFGNYLIKKRQIYYSNFHLIGHSLGSHVSAYAAAKMNNASTNGGKVMRITGLDPAQPGFQNLSTEVRLSKDKAKFVDVVHSDAKPFLPLFGFGYLTNLGHVDFYLNKGFSQPGCTDTEPIKNLTSIDQLANITTNVISDAVACSHGRSYLVFTSSIDPDVKCKFIGHRVVTETPITSNQNSCGKDGQDCIRMGLNTPKAKPRGAFQVVTSTKAPYCCYNYSPVTGCSDTPKGGVGV